MTSTNVNIGFSESKNSSRVLKPPGGGHSDIFGVREGNDIQTPNKRKNHPPTTINSCFIHEEVTKPANTLKEIEKNEDIKNGNENGGQTDVVDENTEPAKENEVKGEEKEKNEQNKPPTPPRRVRVPPGGFSSGLW